MLPRLQYFAKRWLPGTATAGAILLLPVSGSSGQIFYRTLLQASLTIQAAGGSVSIVRSTDSDGPAPASGVTINSQGGTPYLLFVDQGLNATGSQRNLRGGAGIVAYRLCRDPTCVAIWSSDGEATSGILVASGRSPTALPLRVVRAANPVGDGSYSDTVTLTMYF